MQYRRKNKGISWIQMEGESKHVFMTICLVLYNNDYNNSKSGLELYQSQSHSVFLLVIDSTK